MRVGGGRWSKARRGGFEIWSASPGRRIGATIGAGIGPIAGFSARVGWGTAGQPAQGPTPATLAGPVGSMRQSRTAGGSPEFVRARLWLRPPIGPRRGCVCTGQGRARWCAQHGPGLRARVFVSAGFYSGVGKRVRELVSGVARGRGFRRRVPSASGTCRRPAAMPAPRRICGLSRSAGGSADTSRPFAGQNLRQQSPRCRGCRSLSGPPGSLRCGSLLQRK